MLIEHSDQQNPSHTHVRSILCPFRLGTLVSQGFRVVATKKDWLKAAIKRGERRRKVMVSCKEFGRALILCVRQEVARKDRSSIFTTSGTCSLWPYSVVPSVCTNISSFRLFEVEYLCEDAVDVAEHQGHRVDVQIFIVQKRIVMSSRCWS